MHHSRIALGAFVLSLPIAVQFPTWPDTSRQPPAEPLPAETRISLLGGGGRYAIIDRGCQGQVISSNPVRFREVGGSAEHRFANGVDLAVRGGSLREEEEFRYTVTDYSQYPYRDSVAVTTTEARNTYVNPSVGLEYRFFGIGVGWIWSTDPFRTGSNFTEIDPSFHVRFGSLRRVYFRAAFMENVPLYSGGGYFDFGLGFHPHRLWDFYLGGSPGPPFDGLGAAIKADYRMFPNLAFSVRARLGTSGGEAQNGVSIGLTFVNDAPAAPIPAIPP